MRVFLTVLILVLTLQSWTKAENISEFEIEGMSIGDSLLDYFSEEEINKNTYDWYDYIDEKKFLTVALEYKKTFEHYEIVDVAIKINDNKYIIYGLSGVFYLDNSVA